MKKHKILLKILSGSRNITFEEFVSVIISFGFREVRSKGSHHIYKKEGIEELINIQNVEGKAKNYQIKQFISIIEKYNIPLED